MQRLPHDVLYMVCTELRHQRDFDTLFNCACSGKKLASIALPNLYRMHHLAPVALFFTTLPNNQDSDEEVLAYRKLYRKIRQERMLDEPPNFMGWANLWRTIILSSLGKTLYPYSQYIRTLNCKHLGALFLEFQERALVGKTDEDPFRGELAQLRVVKERTAAFKGDSPFFLWNIGQSVGRIQEAVTSQLPLLEELIGDDLHVDTLSRWIPRFPQLRDLNLNFGAEDIIGTGNLIRTHCPSFKRLSFSDVDSGEYLTCDDLADFLYEIRPQSLESFEHFCSYNPSIDEGGMDYKQWQGPEAFQALRCHRESLIDLKVIDINWQICPMLSILKDCVNLESFFLSGIGPDNDHYDIEIGEVLAWLKGCKNLRSLTFREFMPLSLMIPILSGSSIHLTSLVFDASEDHFIGDFKNFYLALANQTSLQSLRIKGKASNHYEQEDDDLVIALCKLVNLTHLNLTKLSDSLDDRHIIEIARSLPKLEIWCTSGDELSDAIWSEIASMGSLRRLIIRAWTFFTAGGILDYVEKLGPGNKGLFVSIIDPFLSSEIRREKGLIQETFAELVGGEFEADDM